MEPSGIIAKAATAPLKGQVIKLTGLSGMSFIWALAASKCWSVALGGHASKSLMMNFSKYFTPEKPSLGEIFAELGQVDLNLTHKELDATGIPALVSNFEEIAVQGKDNIFPGSNLSDINRYKIFIRGLRFYYRTKQKLMLKKLRAKASTRKSKAINDFSGGFIEGIENAGVAYLNLTFMDRELQNSLLQLVNESFTAKTTIDESIGFGMKVMSEVVKNEEFISNSSELSSRVIGHEGVNRASIGLLNACLSHTTTQYYMTWLLSDAMMKTSAKDVMASSLVSSVIEAIHKPETGENLGKMISRILQDTDLIKQAKKALIYTNIARRGSKAQKFAAQKLSEVPETLKEGIESLGQDGAVPDPVRP